MAFGPPEFETLAAVIEKAEIGRALTSLEFALVSPDPPDCTT
jgi:hypothetical protein